MGKFLSTLVLLSLFITVQQARSDDDEDFFKHCPPSRCSKHGPTIRYPFRLESSNIPTSCGAPGYHLSCSGRDTILNHPYIGPCIVTAIDYHRTFLTILPLVDSMSPCPIWKLNSTSISNRQLPNISDDDIFYSSEAILVFCSRSFVPPSKEDYIVGPIQCFSNASHFAYLVSAEAPMFAIPLNCKYSTHISGIPNTVKVTTGEPLDGSTFSERVRRILYLKETAVSWRTRVVHWDNLHEDITQSCRFCEGNGRSCGFSSKMNRTICVRQGSHIKVIAATSSVATAVVLMLMVAAALYVSLKNKYNEEIHLKVEMFLKTYGMSKPCRYTFPQVKKIARRFKDKLGQGGFGSVYRGELLNGVPVAVKILENSTGDGDDFINEVATIGRIHHTNIVRLLGFCSEGTRQALIYEFLPNKSLEKYIFDGDFSTSERLLQSNKMLDIALGIARGMEYLHQGCSQRILHFDIKPHNILLDYNLNPKISDFGLAKLCARDQSMVTLTAARGTMGYIAPELYSRNFGGVSYKSDVYSFGMLVLEMVAGRRNSDPNFESQSDVYLPEFVYDKVITREEPINNRGVTHEEYQVVRKLAIVSLWCIQWNPKQRPSMTKVVNMLTGRLQNLQIPPKPFVPSESHHMQ